METFLMSECINKWLIYKWNYIKWESMRGMSKDDILGFGLVRSYDVEFTFDPRGKRDPLKNFKQGKEKDRLT